jgi:DNA-binding response OmpR family regulator
VTEAPVILAVDDSKVGRKLVEMHLGKAGFHVVTARSSEEALEMLVEMRPHLVLLDVVMPGMNGFELCGRIREQHAGTVPIIFVSAACSLEERTRGLQAGADDFVRKPYDPADLVARVRGHLSRAASLKAAPQRA